MLDGGGTMIEKYSVSSDQKVDTQQVQEYNNAIKVFKAKTKVVKLTTMVVRHEKFYV